MKNRHTNVLMAKSLKNMLSVGLVALTSALGGINQKAVAQTPTPIEYFVNTYVDTSKDHDLNREGDQHLIEYRLGNVTGSFDAQYGITNFTINANLEGKGMYNFGFGDRGEASAGGWGYNHGENQTDFFVDGEFSKEDHTTEPPFPLYLGNTADITAYVDADVWNKGTEYVDTSVQTLDGRFTDSNFEKGVNTMIPGQAEARALVPVGVPESTTSILFGLGAAALYGIRAIKKKIM